MELFNVTKNRYFLAVQVLIDRIYNGAKMTMAEFDEQLRLLSGDSDTVSLNFRENVLKKGIIDIFDFSDRSHVKLRINSRAPLLPCAAEKMWLDMALSDPHCGLFFDKEQRETIRNDLHVDDMIPVHMSVQRERVLGDVITDELGSKLRTVLEAIHINCEIVYSNHTKNGDHICKKAIPYKVEYAIAEDKLRVSMWSTEEERPVKANLSTMFDISIGEKADDLRTIKEMLKEKLLDEPLVFIVTNERGALERAIHTFSKHRRSVMTMDDKHYRFEISYYTFDENSLIADIMSFGPMIEVVSPQRVRDEIIRRIDNYRTLVCKN